MPPLHKTEKNELQMDRKSALLHKQNSTSRIED